MGVFIKQFIAAHFSCCNKKYVELIEFFLTDFNTATKSRRNKLILPRDVSRRTCFHCKSLTFFLLNKFVDFGDYLPPLNILAKELMEKGQFCCSDTQVL